jgi:chaperonin cofactor prefoldin
MSNEYEVQPHEIGALKQRIDQLDSDINRLINLFEKSLEASIQLSNKVGILQGRVETLSDRNSILTQRIHELESK